MKIYKIPKKLKCLIFDIDSTLYTSPSYAFEQVDCQVRQFARLKKVSEEDARKIVLEYRKNFALKNKGKKISLGNTLLSFGISIEQSIKWREELLEPKDFLTIDTQLIKILEVLQKKYKMICVTNNPVLPARKTLEALGVSAFFEHIIGLDTCKKSKPNRKVFRLAYKTMQVKAKNCLAIGDRFDLDVSLPLKMGMGGIVVSGVEDIYQLESILN